MTKPTPDSGGPDSVSLIQQPGINRRTVLEAGIVTVAGTAMAGFAAGPVAAAVVGGLPKSWDMEVDLVCIGASCGGMVAALLGHDFGMKSVVLEKGELIGGGGARAGGEMWIANNRHQKANGLPDSREAAIEYIRNTSYGRHDEEKMVGFVDNGSEMVEYLNERTPLKTEGGEIGGYDTSLGVTVFNDIPGARLGRGLGANRNLIVKMMKARRDKSPLLQKLRPLGYGDDGSSPGLQVGVIGGLALGFVDRNIPILTETRAQRLVMEGDRVIGVCARKQGRDFYIKANRGVLIASGGFEWNRQLVDRFVPIPGPIPPITPSVNEGDGLIMGMEVGAALAMMDCGVWVPALITPGDDWGGLQEGGYDSRVYPVDGPGEIFVNKAGKRCCDESYIFSPPAAMAAQSPTYDAAYPNWPMFWIADQARRDRGDVGPVRKGTEIRPWLYRAETLRDLAGQLGINPDALGETVARYNKFSKEGADPDFGRARVKLGNDVVRQVREKMLAERGPGQTNPLTPPPVAERLGTIEKPPFYGAKIGVGSAGTRGGLLTNAHAQVIHIRGHVIPGLYATSNVAAQTAVGVGYTDGYCHGQSAVFGYVAAKHMAGKRTWSS